MMSDPCRVLDGSCLQCEISVEDNEVIKCFSCQGHFHALCKKSANAICNKSLLQIYMQKSTKKNFVWYCDSCLTNLEISGTESQSSQTKILETLMTKLIF